MSFMDWFYIFAVIVFGSLMAANLILAIKDIKSEKKKNEVERLKELRKKNVSKKADKKVAEYINRIKEDYTDGDEYTEFFNYTSISFHYKTVTQRVLEWLDSTGIKYETEYTGSFIKIIFKEDENNA